MRASFAAARLTLLLAACTAPPAEESLPDAAMERGGAAATAPADLEERLAPGVLARISDRRAWRDRVLADDAVPPERKAEAEAEVGLLHHAYDLFEPTVEAYGRAIDRAHGDYRWHYLRGLAARRLNDLEAAAADFARATELAPEDVPSWVRLGEVARDLGDETQAKQALEAALQLDPECAAAAVALGQLARAEGDLAAAARRFERVLELQPDASVARTPLGLIYRDLGRDADAAAQLERAGDQGVRLKDPLLQRVYELGEGWSAAMREASEAARDGDLEATEKRLMTAIGMDPLSAASRLAWARLLLQRGDPEGAREQAELALFLSHDESQPRRVLARIGALSGGSRRGRGAAREVPR